MDTSTHPHAHSIFGGHSVADFDENIREQCSAHFEGALTSRDASTLFNTTRLWALLGNHPSYAAVDVITDGLPRSFRELLEDGSINQTSDIRQLVEDGASARIRDLQDIDDAIGAFVTEVAQLLEAKCQVNCYLTPPQRRGFNPHFDTADVIIVQCEGMKHWQLYSSYRDQQTLPLRDTPWEPDRYLPIGEPRTICLAPGDTLYLPRGTMHEAFCTMDTSLHLTVSVDPQTVFDVLVEQLKELAVADKLLRQRSAGVTCPPNAASLMGAALVNLTRE